MAVSDRGDWLRGVDLNHRPLGYEPNELPDCSTPQKHDNSAAGTGSNRRIVMTVMMSLEQPSQDWCRMPSSTSP
jgi:hypothetical protein